VIAQKLVGLMGGKIGAHSVEHEGSRFAFTIHMPVAQLASGATSTTQIPRLESLAVLVAEDNLVNQTIIEAMLARLGHRCQLVSTGRDAIQALASADFDLVLMDCNMPVMDGFEATAHIRAGESPVRDPRIPIVALTANAMQEDRERCLAAGMDDFLSKPLTISELRKALERVRESERSVAA
jgi:CheY-like chemotaxis protein